MDSEIIVKRLYDYEIVLGTMDAVWDDISETGVDRYQPDLINEIWLGLFLNGKYLGMYRFNSLSRILLEGHVFMLPEMRKHSLLGGQAVMSWLCSNTGFNKVIVNIPECFPNVIKFVSALGLAEQGYNSEAWSRDGVFGIFQYGITRDQIKCQQQ
tara:strand:- start:4950 stop:5414 length:465 start_codon:yes stop_codon:yes gene_type:complete